MFLAIYSVLHYLSVSSFYLWVFDNDKEYSYSICKIFMTKNMFYDICDICVFVGAYI